MNSNHEFKIDAVVVENAILGLLAKRHPNKTICPSEAARLLYPAEIDWRAAMPAVRIAAQALASRGVLEVTQGGRVVDISVARGAIRLRLPSA